MRDSVFLRSTLGSQGGGEVGEEGLIEYCQLLSVVLLYPVGPSRWRNVSVQACVPAGWAGLSVPRVPKVALA
jgi:hypothetical protein